MIISWIMLKCEIAIFEGNWESSLSMLCCCVKSIVKDVSFLWWLYWNYSSISSCERTVYSSVEDCYSDCSFSWISSTINGDSSSFSIFLDINLHQSCFTFAVCPSTAYCSFGSNTLELTIWTSPKLSHRLKTAFPKISAAKLKCANAIRPLFLGSFWCSTVLVHRGMRPHRRAAQESMAKEG